MKKVAIVQRLLPHYRVDFFNGLKNTLEKNGVQLVLIYGSSEGKESLKKDEAEIEWAYKIKNLEFKLSSTKLYWQPCLKLIRDADLVIVEQANKNLINYLLMFSRVWSKRKLAFWGHGLNQQAQKDSLGNKFKKIFLNQCSWWFAYTNGVKNFLTGNQYPRKKITVVQNAIDTKTLRLHYDQISDSEIASLKAQLNINSENIGLFCGGMYKEKRLDFLFHTAEMIKQKIPDFCLILIGSGPEAYKADKAAKDREWIYYLGPKFDREKVLYFKMAKAFLMPGLVGLAVLDSFSLLTPMFTTDYPYHSPEIEYLIHGYNGFVTENDPESYSSEIISYLNSPASHIKILKGCNDSYSKYTIEQMVNNYSDGIYNCLSLNS